MKTHMLRYQQWLAYIPINIPTGYKVWKIKSPRSTHPIVNICMILATCLQRDVHWVWETKKGHSLSTYSGSSRWIADLQQGWGEDSATLMVSPTGGRHLFEKKVAIPLFLEMFFSVKWRERFTIETFYCLEEVKHRKTDTKSNSFWNVVLFQTVRV